jgi:septal ring factor EnvC (AmiA/AmiB activator)
MTRRPESEPERADEPRLPAPGPRPQYHSRHPLPGAAASVLAFALMGALAPVTAQGPPDPARQRNDAQRQLETSSDTLRTAQQRAQTIQQDVQQLNSEQARINEQLIELGRLAQTSEARLSQIEARMSELDVLEKQLRGSLAARHDRIAKLFSAMQRMGRNPPPVIVTRREDALQMVRSAMLLARAFPELKSQADELSHRLKELLSVMAQAREEGERLKSETARLSDARTRLAAMVETKRRSVSERQKELEDVRRSAAEIARSVTDLSDLIGRLDKAVAQRTLLAEYERELSERAAREAREKEAAEATARAAAAPPTSPPAGAPAAGPAGPLAQRPADSAAPSRPAVRPTIAEPSLPDPGKDSGTQVASVRPVPPRTTFEPQGALAANPGRMKPAIPFHLARGQLPTPAQGRRILGFNEKNQFGRQSRGIVIETRHGATVIAPSDGWVVYAGEFRSYGQVLIINAGGGYHVLLANLARTDVEVGRFVLAGEPVGAMSSNMVGKSQDSAPVLYVEFRNKEGQSIDPTPWWADGSQKVQG